ncbi:MAG TPA: hypothetical protein VK084_08375 [Chitinophagaceae bacterium]|nr:hypothetical protein [Chitinophagaceae bacterium]
MNDTLTTEEKDFIEYWEKEGYKEKNFGNMLKKYLPKGLIYSLPIILFFFAMGYKRKGIVTHAELTIIMICVLLIAVAYSILKGHVKNDRKFSYYQILKMKEEKCHSSPDAD